MEMDFPFRTLPTSAGRKHAKQDPPLSRTLGYTRPAEPSSRSSAAKRCIYDMGIRNPEDEFAHRNSGKDPGFTEQPVVGSAFEFKECLQISGVIGQARQNSFIAIAVFSGDQAVGIVAREFGNLRMIY